MANLYDTLRKTLARGIEESIAVSIVTNVATQLMTNGKPVSGWVGYQLGNSKGFAHTIDNFNFNCIIVDNVSVDKNAHSLVVSNLYANKVKDHLLLAYLDYIILSIAKTRLPASRALIHFAHAIKPIFDLDGFAITGCGIKDHPVTVKPEMIDALIKHGLDSTEFYPKVKPDNAIDDNGVNIFDL